MNKNQLRESTLFRDYDNKNQMNNELKHLQMKIARKPLIILPDVVEEISIQPEISKIEVIFNNLSIIIGKTSYSKCF